MPYYRSAGDVPHKRHVRTSGRDGRPLYEELVGEEGFSGDSSLLYHLRSPSALVGAKALVDDRPELVANHPLLPRHIRTGLLDGGDPAAADPVRSRRPLLGNQDVLISWVEAHRSSPVYRNASGDELVFVHAGRATVETVFGALDVSAGDYVVIPRSTTHQWVVRAGDRIEMLVTEAQGHIRPPRRYLSPTGQFLEQAPYCERDIRAPDAPPAPSTPGDAVDVIVRDRAGLSRHTTPSTPFDVVGWAGCLYPWAFSIHDFEPIVGSIHQPPHVHQTFEGPGFVVCSFVPRPYDFHEGAIKVPYHHANVDSDEVIFYSAGDFMSRAGSGIGVGSISLHPNGFVHGPQPGSMERAATQDRTEELAVMIDTFRPLRLSPAALATCDERYPWSWSRS